MQTLGHQLRSFGEAGSEENLTAFGKEACVLIAAAMARAREGLAASRRLSRKGPEDAAFGHTQSNSGILEGVARIRRSRT